MTLETLTIHWPHFLAGLDPQMAKHKCACLMVYGLLVCHGHVWGETLKVPKLDGP